MQTQENHLLADIEKENENVLASSGQRFWNSSIDGIGMVILMVLLLNLTVSLSNNGLMDDESSFRIVLFFLFILIAPIYYTIMEGLTKGRTFGKLITKTKVVKENGDPIGFKEAVVRSVSRLAPFEHLSILFGRPWHDQWSKTKVIRVD